MSFLGKKIIPADQTEQSLITRYAQVHPLRFEMKGNYGVSIVWSDGFNADIFPFDVLKKISEEERALQH
jgi:DUF971 family protein